jgi:oligopeptide transport system substrate-binding protein
MQAIRSRWLVGAVVAAIVGAACSSGAGGGSTTSSSPKAAHRGGTFSMANGEPDSLIPQRNYESHGIQVFEALFTRLVSFSDTGQILMAQAKSITSPDQKVWTIEIQPGWTFHNGEPVTAQSYADAWNWAALGSNGAILNFFFERIDGYDALNPSKGKATATTLSGLKVLGPTTLQVTLSAPFSQFPYQLGFDAFDPLPKAFFQDVKAFNEMPIGDGPYQMDGPWQHDHTIDLKRYPNYRGSNPGFADAIKLPEYTGGSDFADLEGGNIDIDLVGSSHISQALQEFPDTTLRLPSSGFVYLDYPLYDPRFQNKELRQALSLAVDRGAVIKAILVNETPADSLAAPVIAGYRKGACQYCHLDVSAAKQKLAAAGGWTGQLVLNFPAGDPILEQAMEAVANQWRQNLGIQDIKLNPIDSNSYYDVAGGHQMKGPFWDGWTQDYPSIQDYLEPIYGKNGGNNLTGYSNPAFDQLLAQGDEAPSTAASIAIYQQAESLALEDMPIIPWGYARFNIVYRDTVTNVVRNGSFDNVALEKVQVVG